MSAIEFREPNYRCRVSRVDDPDGKKSWRLCYAEDAPRAEELLQQKGLVIHKIESYDFEEWLKRAEKETEKTIAAFQSGQELYFKALWRDLKDHLLDLSHDKCAYCESRIGFVGYADINHYRPKARVAEDENHQGYYWLAYDPHNFLPACQYCGQLAKKAHFPIVGTRAYGPGDSLEDEEPLLLNPYLDNWSEHVRFVPSSATNPGYAVGLTPRGASSIEILKLNRPELVTMRLQEQVMVRNQLKQAWTQVLMMEDQEALHHLVSEIGSGRRQFSTAALFEIGDFSELLGLPSFLS